MATYLDFSFAGCGMGFSKGIFTALKEFLNGLLYGSDGRPSCTTVMAVAAFLLFVFVTLFLVLSGRGWEHYSVFAGVTCGGGLSAQVGGKYINAKHNAQQ
jgi:hypothetical protein